MLAKECVSLPQCRIEVSKNELDEVSYAQRSKDRPPTVFIYEV